MICNYENPEMIEAAKQKRRELAKTDLLAAGESSWEEFVPTCGCPKCMAAMEADEDL